MAGARLAIGTRGGFPGRPAWRRASYGLTFVAMVCAGCGTYITSGLLDESPTEAEIAKLAPQHRAGVMCQVAHVNKELKSKLPAFVGTLKEAQGAGYVEGLIRLAYLPEPLPGGKGVKPVANLVSIRGGGKNPLDAGLVWGLSFAKARNIVSGLTLDALRKARRKSGFHKPVGAKLGKLDCWAIGDMPFYNGKHYATAEMYLNDPGGGEAPGTPDRVLILSVRAKGGEWTKRGKDALFSFGGRIYRLAEVKQHGGRLGSLAADKWTPDVDDVIAGRTAALLKLMSQTEAIGYLNDFLLTWKTKGMPARLRGMNVEELEDLAIRLEKSILRYDMESKKRKDAAQAKVVEGGSGEADMQVAHLLDQRKTLLLAILKSTKQVLAVRRRTR